MEIFIEGIGVVGAFGSGTKEFGAALDRGKTEFGSAGYREGEGAEEMPVFVADTSRLDDFLPRKSLRRIDHYSKMAILGSYLALEDASLLDIDRKSLGIVIASGYGASATTFAFLDSFIVSTDTYSSPTHFSNSVHNAAAAHISIFLGATGPCLTVSEFEMSVPSALVSAAHMLEEGRVEKVLFGSVDEYCNVLGYCLSRFFGVNRGPVIEPLLFDRQSAIPGEGAAFFLLSGRKQGAKGYGRITDVQIDYSERARLPRPGGTLFILGADGYKECGSRYGEYITGDMNVTSYASLFGSFPTNAAFDLAVASLSIRENRIYGLPGGITRPPGLNIPAASDHLDAERICCLKLGSTGESGVITVEPC